jgi:glycerol kinase
MKKKYIGAIDQGTTSTRFVVFNRNGEMVSMDKLEHRQIFPRPNWVEHDPVEIKNNTFTVIQNAMKKADISGEEFAAIGITNQRETTVVWNPKTGEPFYNAVVWQDTRTDEICKSLAEDNNPDCYRKKTGLPLSTYFSGPKIKWLIENVKEINNAAKWGNAVFGNMDSWIIWWLTGGPKKGMHVTDVTNASRTMLMDLETLDWDLEMLDIMGVPQWMMPDIKSSSEVYGYTQEDGIFACRIPVSGDLGDQQAALFGQTCFEAGEAKNTYGTGCFMLMNSGEKMVRSKHGLLTTVGYKIGNQNAVYALEGSIAIAGSLVQWLRDNLGMIKEAPEIEDLAKSVDDNGGIYFVPAFSGLFAPHWRSDARGLIIGLTHYINRGHIARAVLESTAFQAREIFKAMEKDSGIKLKSLKVDGGMVTNELLMQFQADILGIPVIRPKITETTVLGAAYAAGLAVGFWEKPQELKAKWKMDREWQAEMPQEKREALYGMWKKAVERSCAWI